MATANSCTVNMEGHGDSTVASRCPPLVGATSSGHAPAASKETVELQSVTQLHPKSVGSRGAGAVCRLCHGGEEVEGFVSPCMCTGRRAFVHPSCLERKLQSTYRDQCEFCGDVFRRLTSRPSTFREFLANDDSIGLIFLLIWNLFSSLTTPLGAAAANHALVSEIMDSLAKNGQATGLIIGVVCLDLFFLFFVVVFVLLLAHTCAQISEWRKTHTVATHEFVDLVDPNACVLRTLTQQPPSLYSMVAAPAALSTIYGF